MPEHLQRQYDPNRNLPEVGARKENLNSNQRQSDAEFESHADGRTHVFIDRDTDISYNDYLNDSTGSFKNLLYVYLVVLVYVATAFCFV